MRILVAITNYGMKNIKYAKQLIQEYRSMPFEVDIFVLSEAPKDFGSDVTVLVGLPSKDPWSLPFGHKQLFAENVENYDLFIYTEDDMFIRKNNILAYLKASEIIGGNFLPGFVQYELYPDGKKTYLQAHGPYHWIPGSVKKAGEYTFAEFSNAHSACYILTQAQLRRALASGGFLVPPHSGRYDLLCSASTDPYIQCGFTRIVCLSHLQDFEIHHLPNAYLNRKGLISDNTAGLDEEGYKSQISALLEISDGKRSNQELLITEKPIPTGVLDKNYYEECRYDILELIPSKAQDILSVGCGWGATESRLLESGKRVMVIPLDSIISKRAESMGMYVLPPDFSQAFEMLGDRKFDAIILSEVLQHMPIPGEILSQLMSHLNVHGVVVGSVPNLDLSRRLFGRLFAKNKKKFRVSGNFNSINLHLTNTMMIKNWLRASGIHAPVIKLQYESPASPLPFISKLARYIPKRLIAPTIIFAAEQISE